MQINQTLSTATEFGGHTLDRGQIAGRVQALSSVTITCRLYIAKNRFSSISGHSSSLSSVRLATTPFLSPKTRFLTNQWTQTQPSVHFLTSTFTLLSSAHPNRLTSTFSGPTSLSISRHTVCPALVDLLHSRSWSYKAIQQLDKRRSKTPKYYCVFYRNHLFHLYDS